MNTATNNPQSFLSIWVLRLLRIPLLLVHVLIGMPLTIVTFNKLGRGILIRGRSLDVVMLNWWGRPPCRIVGVRVIAVGVIAPEPVLVVANHMSWLDAPVMHSIGRMGFVAKAEIRRWPLLGWMAMAGGTVFHTRGSDDSMGDTASAVSRRLLSGRSVAIYPEGRGYTGERVHRFHARLFRVAVDTGVSVQPLCIRDEQEGKLNLAIPFAQGEALLPNLFRVLGARSSVVRVFVLPIIPSAGQSRDELARLAEKRVSEIYGELEA